MSAIDIFELLYEPFKLDPSRPVRLFEAFSGIGTQHMALKRLGLEVDLVGISEVDKFAIASYEAIHGKVKNYGGIGSFEKLPNNIDICTWSFPCQDISLAGKQKGMVEGSRSNYGYVFLDTVEKTDIKPQLLLMENVRALFSETFREDWREIQLRLERMGYKNYAEILNSKDYGVAQNRERVFIVSILGDYNYNFPKPFKLEKKLKDYLEDEVDEKYYLSDKMYRTLSGVDYNNPNFDRTKVFKPYKENVDTTKPITINPKVDGKQPSLQDRIYSEGTSTAITTSFHPFIIVPEATKQGFKKAYDGDGVYINRPHQKRGVVQKDMIQTLKTQQDVGVIVKNPLKDKTKYGWHFEQEVYDKDGLVRTIKAGGGSGNIPKVILNNNLRIRKLTPKETWRLMGIKDEDFEKANKVTSDSQLYKQAGNAIVVDVLYYIFKELIN